MPFFLRRLSDGAGDSGPMSEVFYDDGINYERLHGVTRPTVGYQIKVGSIDGRTYQPQYWWQTNPVLEILVDEPHYVKFRTVNSVYEWRCT